MSDAPSLALYEADRKAHEEAITNGGVRVLIDWFLYPLTWLKLIMYWYGVPDPETGLNLATCIWQSRKHAIAANSRPHHIRAMKLAAASYEVYRLERYRVSKIKGVHGLQVAEYDGTEVGC